LHELEVESESLRGQAIRVYRPRHDREYVMKEKDDTSGLPNSPRIGCRKRLRLDRRPPSLRGDDVEALMTMVMGMPPKLAQRAREL
jgi:hypothetical protein